MLRCSNVSEIISRCRPSGLRLCATLSTDFVHTPVRQMFVVVGMRRKAGLVEWNARLVQAYDAYTDVQRAMNQAQVFYNDMSHTANQLAMQAERLLAERRAERSSILMSSDTIPAATTAPRATTLAEDLAALRMSNPSSRGPPPPPRPPRI